MPFGAVAAEDFISASPCPFTSELGDVRQGEWAAATQVSGGQSQGDCVPLSSAHQPGPQLHQPGCAGAQLSPGPGGSAASLRDQGCRPRQLHQQSPPQPREPGGERPGDWPGQGWDRGWGGRWGPGRAAASSGLWEGKALGCTAPGTLPFRPGQACRWGPPLQACVPGP